MPGWPTIGPMCWQFMVVAWAVGPRANGIIIVAAPTASIIITSHFTERHPTALLNLSRTAERRWARTGNGPQQLGAICLVGLGQHRAWRQLILLQKNEPSPISGGTTSDGGRSAGSSYSSSTTASPFNHSRPSSERSSGRRYSQICTAGTDNCCGTTGYKVAMPTRPGRQQTRAVALVLCTRSPGVKKCALTCTNCGAQYWDQVSHQRMCTPSVVLIHRAVGR